MTATSFQMAQTWTSDGSFAVCTQTSFLSALGLEATQPVVTISIVGKFRTGKSYIQNHVFPDKQLVFEESPLASPCTKGIHIAVAKTKDYDILLIDTEGTEALLSSEDVHVLPGGDMRVRFDRLEDRVKAMLGVIMANSDIVLFVVKSNAIDKADLAYLEEEGLKFNRLYYQHLMIQKLNLETGAQPAWSKVMANRLANFQGPRLIICHRFDSKEVRPADHKRLGNIISQLKLLVVPGRTLNTKVELGTGAFADIARVEMDINNAKAIVQLKTEVTTMLDRVWISIFPAPAAGWFAVMSSMLNHLCPEPPRFAELKREHIIDTMAICPEKCLICDLSCNQFFAHIGQCNSTGECKASRDRPNTVFVHIPCGKKLKESNSWKGGRNLSCSSCGGANTFDAYQFQFNWKLGVIPCGTRENLEQFKFVKEHHLHMFRCQAQKAPFECVHQRCAKAACKQPKPVSKL